MRYPILACAAGLGLLALLGGPDPAAADEVNAEGVAKGSIALGTSTPLTGPVGPPCRPISDASSAWFKHVNEAGGVNGRTIDYTVLDDAYKAPEALANGRELARKPVFALFAGCGTLQPPVLLPIAKSNGLLYLFPFAGNPELMTTDFVYNLFPLYGEQYAGLVSSALKLNGAGSLIYVVADVPGVDENIASVKAATEAAGGTFLSAEKINQQEPDYAPLALKMKSMSPDYIVIHTTAPASAKLVKAMDANDAMPAKFMLGAATQASPSFLQSVEGLVDGKMLVALPVAPASSDRAKTCVDVIRKYEPDLPLDSFSLWGCAIAQVFTEALRDAPEPLTRASFVETLKGWKGKEATEMFGPITFDNPKHLGMTEMVLTKIEGNEPVVIGEVALPQ